LLALHRRLLHIGLGQVEPALIGKEVTAPAITLAVIPELSAALSQADLKVLGTRAWAWLWLNHG